MDRLSTLKWSQICRFCESDANDQRAATDQLAALRQPSDVVQEVERVR